MRKTIRYCLISALVIIISTLVLFLSVAVVAFKTSTATIGDVDPPHNTYIIGIEVALHKYAQKHKGLFPVGKSSTEIFQRLIDDGDATPRIFCLDLPGKQIALNNKLSSENVCYDFTEGATENSPAWLPIVIPTGYSINYKTGEAIRLPSYAITDDSINVVFPSSVITFPVTTYKFYFFKQSNINIMPNKPVEANVEQYHQLTPDESSPY